MGYFQRFRNGDMLHFTRGPSEHSDNGKGSPKRFQAAHGNVSGGYLVIGDIMFIDSEGYVGASRTIVDEFDSGIHEIASEKGNLET